MSCCGRYGGGRVWAGRPYTIVEDRPSRLVLYSRAGGRWMRPARTDGTVLRVREPGWVLREDAWAIEVAALRGLDGSRSLRWLE